MPFDLFDGGELPEMITAERDDVKYFMGMAPAYLKYGKLVKHLKDHTLHEYDHLLKGWVMAFGDLGLGKMRPGLLAGLLWTLLVKKRARNRFIAVPTVSGSSGP